MKFMIKLAAAAVVVGLAAGCGATRSPTGNDGLSAKKIDPDAVHRRSLGTKSKPRQKIYKPKTTRPLEIPPDLITSTDPAVLENLAAAEASASRILPETVGARVVKKDGVYGLEIDTNVESAWKTVTQFWSLSGIGLVEYNPEAGIMETEWIKEARVYDEDDSPLKTLGKELLTALANRNAAMDKYRIRFERISPEQSHMHVNHRRMARKGIERNKKVTEFEWVELSSDPNHVADFLQNIVLIFDDSAAS